MAKFIGVLKKRGILPWLVGAALLIPVLAHPSAIAQASRVVTIHIDEQTASFPTEAQTVEEALGVAGIQVGEHDLVEPSADTPIITDTFNINVFRARPVVVIDGDERIETVSPYQSPKLIAEQAGLTIYPEDNFVLERIDDFVGESRLGLKLTVVRATELKLSLYGTTKDIRTQASTVGELLDQHGLEPSEDDIIRPKRDNKLTAGMTVHIVRVSGDTVVKEEVIPYERRLIQDTSQPIGYEDIETPGQNGSKLVTYKITFENGEEVSRKPINTVIVEQPVEEVAVVGADYTGLYPDNAAILAALRQCETGGNYVRVSSNGLYYGAYQFLKNTWDRTAQRMGEMEWYGVPPNEARKDVQDRFVLNNANASSGGFWSQHPGCSDKLNLPKFPY